MVKISWITASHFLWGAVIFFLFSYWPITYAQEDDDGPTPEQLHQAQIDSATAIVNSLTLTVEKHNSTKLLEFIDELPFEIKSSFTDKIEREHWSCRDAIHYFLQSSFSSYQQATEAFRSGQGQVDSFLPINQSDKKDTLSLALKAYSLYFTSRIYIEKREFKNAIDCIEQILKDPSLNKFFTWDDESVFYLGYSYAKSLDLDSKVQENNRLLALCLLQKIEIISDVPVRIKDSGNWLKRELEGEGFGPLLDITERVEDITHDIVNLKTGKVVQEKQEKIVKDLDFLIQQAQEKEDDAKAWSNLKDHPPIDSNDQPGRGKAKKYQLDDPKFGGGWKSSMTEVERQRAIQIVDSQFPVYYRDLIEQYFKDLAQKSEKHK